MSDSRYVNQHFCWCICALAGAWQTTALLVSSCSLSSSEAQQRRGASRDRTSTQDSAVAEVFTFCQLQYRKHAIEATSQARARLVMAKQCKRARSVRLFKPSPRSWQRRAIILEASELTSCSQSAVLLAAIAAGTQASHKCSCMTQPALFGHSNLALGQNCSNVPSRNS